MLIKTTLIGCFFFVSVSRLRTTSQEFKPHFANFTHFSKIDCTLNVNKMKFINYFRFKSFYFFEVTLINFLKIYLRKYLVVDLNEKEKLL